MEPGVNFRVKGVILLRRTTSLLLFTSHFIPYFFHSIIHLIMTEENLPSTVFQVTVLMISNSVLVAMHVFKKC